MKNSLIKALMDRYNWNYFQAYQEYLNMRIHVSYGGCPLQQLADHELEEELLIELI